MRASPKQLALAHWWHRPATRGMDGVIAEGAVRSGKTYAMVAGFLTWSRSEFHGGAFIVAGRSVGALSATWCAPWRRSCAAWDGRTSTTAASSASTAAATRTTSSARPTRPRRT